MPSTASLDTCQRLREVSDCCPFFGKRSVESQQIERLACGPVRKPVRSNFGLGSFWVRHPTHKSKVAARPRSILLRRAPASTTFPTPTAARSRWTRFWIGPCATAATDLAALSPKSRQDREQARAVAPETATLIELLPIMRSAVRALTAEEPFPEDRRPARALSFGPRR